ncbi:ABC transporter permease [Botrimarina mediterranea]|uniref:Oligopeptide transport system permease protein OppB n=1 Tax=Botrimarina mediterranea TaxID=2528022 RepID=A0A518K5F1_9BACT|nr:ABC transporter permease [Botrimarina mediterranea]QDV73016.1 Oligopeptide transport system permease protein OppB [Botrimarina mediterranea]QDV77590.1 Oligopeptide transport system permease protein OppB [Planctomycetes bacterium K2D]
MTTFLLRRFGWMLITLWVVFTVSFFLMRSVPGGPYDSERALEPEIEANIKKKYRLDLPLTEQYVYNLGETLSGDLGVSMKKDYTTNRLVSEALPVSAALGLLALAFAFSIGLVAGVVSAVFRGTFADFALMSIATVGIALPNFVVAGFAIILFVFILQWLPAAGWGSLDQLVLPALCLGAPYAAYVARIARTGMLDVLGQDHIRTARAKGLSPFVVVAKHALPTALLPVVSFLGPAVAGILTGSPVIEQIFAIPGLGWHFVQAAIDKDYPIAMGLVLLYTTLLYVMNLIVDLLYGVLDPRVEWK